MDFKDTEQKTATINFLKNMGVNVYEEKKNDELSINKLKEMWGMK